MQLPTLTKPGSCSGKARLDALCRWTHDAAFQAVHSKGNPMRLHTTRRRVMQTALASAATVTLPRSRAAAQQATPTAGSDAEIPAAQVQSALDRLDSLI